MGTKNSPGKFDCYENAEPDEPMFVLVARDPFAPLVVRYWALLRRQAGKTLPEKLNEAEQCAESMEEWYGRNRATKQ